MEGIEFVRSAHLSIAEGMYLPRADLLGFVSNSLHSVLYQRPDLKSYLPDLLKVDVFATWDGEKFMLLISPDCRGHLPTRGMETSHSPAQREVGRDTFQNFINFTDISGLPIVEQSFKQVGFEPGFAIVGTFPAGDYSPEAMTLKEQAGQQIAAIMLTWAEIRKRKVENSRIFLSYKGTNKPFIEKIDQVLRLINLRTWFDKDDLAAGDPLVRGVDRAFSSCSAVVFFISGDYIDAGVIGKEIDRAIHEAATRKGGFKIIPLVLAQHGGTDSRVPEPLRTLVWKTVQDIEIVPTILRLLPPETQAAVRYNAPKPSARKS